MAELVTNLDEIKRLAREHEQNDWDFRTFLRGGLDWSDARLDTLVHEITQAVTEAIDCKSCGNCCRVMAISVSKADMPPLAEGLGMTQHDFEERYITANDTGEMFITESPCPFLEGSLCSVYDHRPKDCREFPHLHKDRFRSRTFAVLSELEICPIVYNVWQLLKEEFRFW